MMHELYGEYLFENPEFQKIYDRLKKDLWDEQALDLTDAFLYKYYDISERMKIQYVFCEDVTEVVTYYKNNWSQYSELTGDRSYEQKREERLHFMVRYTIEDRGLLKTMEARAVVDMSDVNTIDDSLLYMRREEKMVAAEPTLEAALKIINRSGNKQHIA